MNFQIHKLIEAVNDTSSSNRMKDFQLLILGRYQETPLNVYSLVEKKKRNCIENIFPFLIFFE